MTEEFDEDICHEKILAVNILEALKKTGLGDKVVLRALFRAAKYWAQDKRKGISEFIDAFATHLPTYMEFNEKNNPK